MIVILGVVILLMAIARSPSNLPNQQELTSPIQSQARTAISYRLSSDTCPLIILGRKAGTAVKDIIATPSLAAVVRVMSMIILAFFGVCWWKFAKTDVRTKPAQFIVASMMHNFATKR